MNLNKAFFIRGQHNLRAEHRGSVLTIGSFDGLHLGHRAIIEQVKERASYYKVPSVVMMFEPQPREYFSGEQAPARLMRMREKADALGKVGVDRVFCVRFNQALCELSAQEFIDKLLIEGLGVKCLVIGDDFRFGCDRKGDFTMLAEQGQRHDFEVLETHTVTIGGQRVSSTRIRQALEAGDFEGAEDLLGEAFRITGKVVYGQQLGGQLGIPTANVNLHRYRAPLRGVFAVEVVLDGDRIKGVANVGVRPTVGDLIKPVLEVHMLDWSGDIYGQRIAVEFKRKLREEHKFTSLDDLVKSIRQDIVNARQYFGLPA